MGRFISLFPQTDRSGPVLEEAKNLMKNRHMHISKGPKIRSFFAFYMLGFRFRFLHIHSSSFSI
jgi:hypothetical protein